MSEAASRVHTPVSPTGDERQLAVVRRDGSGGEWAASSAQAPRLFCTSLQGVSSLIACIIWLVLPHANCFPQRETVAPSEKDDGCLLSERLGGIVTQLPGWCQPCWPRTAEMLKRHRLGPHQLPLVPWPWGEFTATRLLGKDMLAQVRAQFVTAPVKISLLQ
jgi:hypothetical protein